LRFNSYPVSLQIFSSLPLAVNPVGVTTYWCYFSRIIIYLYIGGSVLHSEEGTTQGDPLAMPMYALGVIPLIKSLSGSSVQQIWYADDATACGSLKDLRSWWDKLTSEGPGYGYFS